jgi:hypothetical protein
LIESKCIGEFVLKKAALHIRQNNGWKNFDWEITVNGEKYDAGK